MNEHVPPFGGILFSTDVARYERENRYVSSEGGLLSPGDFRQAVKKNISTDFDEELRSAQRRLRPEGTEPFPWDRRRPWVTAPVMRCLRQHGSRIEALQWRGDWELQDVVGQRLFPTIGCCTCFNFIHPNEFVVEMVGPAERVLATAQRLPLACSHGQVKIPKGGVLALMYPLLWEDRDESHYRVASVIQLGEDGELVSPEPFMSSNLCHTLAG